MTLPEPAPVRPAPVRTVSGVTPERFAAEIRDCYQPVIMRGLAADWPSVAAACAGVRPMADYLLRFDRGAPAEVMIGAPEIAGRFFYNDALTGFNFQRGRVTLPVLLEQLVAQQRVHDGPALYAGAASAPENFPGWTDANPLSLPTPDATPRIWIGNSSRVSTHYDLSSNIAVVVAGRRRFTLFPPEQVTNLYVGPLDITIAGQPVSMVDLHAPDLVRYPRFAEARRAMQVAELEPGDAIFIPSLWWHEVEAIGPLNVLVNYWWGQQSTASPIPALVHAMLTVRDLPAAERSAMRAWFDHFVFGEEAASRGEHLPPHVRGPFGTKSAARDDAARTYLIRTLERAAGATGS